MLISELLTKLEDIKKEHGDMEFVVLHDMNGAFGISYGPTVDLIEVPDDEDIDPVQFTKVVMVSDTISFEDARPGLHLVKSEEE